MSQITEPIDYDLQLMTVEELRACVMKARTNLRIHRDERGHERCHESDTTLIYSLLPETIEADLTIPPDAEHEGRCRLWRIRNRCSQLQSATGKLWEVHIWRPGMYPSVRADYESQTITFEKWTLTSRTPGRTPLTLEIFPEEQRSLNYSQVPPKVTVCEKWEAGGEQFQLSYGAYFYRIREDVIMLFSWHNNPYIQTPD